MSLSAEQTTSLKHLFERADRDKSGSLNRREVRHLVRRIFRQQNREEFDAKYLANYANVAFKEHDTDNSQSLDFDEFVKLYHKLMSDTQIPEKLKRKATFSLLKPDTVQLTEEDKREYLKNRHSVAASQFSLVVKKVPLNRQNSSSNMPELIIKSHFAKYSNTNGNVTSEGLQKLAYDLGIYISDDEARIVMGNLDCDGSGDISLEEFISWWRTEKKFEKLASIETQEMQQAVQYFQYFDSDKNGVVCQNEWTGLHADLVKNGLMGGGSTAEQAWTEVSESGVVNFNSFLQWMGLARI